jgi:hypothetical protein
MYLSLKHLKTLLPLLGLLFLNSSCSSTSSRSDQEVPKGLTPFAGGKFEASGVADVPGTDGILFVDNGREGQVLWMELDQKGKQVGAINTLSLGVSIEDIEGITTDVTSFYVVSSQSRPKAIAREGLVRFKFDQRSHSIKDAESISGLKAFLVANVAELRDGADRNGKDGGLNIEGLAWDPRGGRLLLGLRSPIVDGHALVVPLRLRDQRGAFSLDNLEVENSKAIRLPLGGVGIRSIEYDGRAKVFRIISGAAENQDQTDFVLWEWNGNEQQPMVRETKRFEKSLKPEGVARATAGSHNFLIIVFDASGYTILK